MVFNTFSFEAKKKEKKIEITKLNFGTSIYLRVCPCLHLPPLLPCARPTAAPYAAGATWPPHASHPRPIHPHAHWITKTTPPWLCAHATRAPGISPCATPPTATHGDATSPSSRLGPNRPPHGLFCFALKTPRPINQSPRPSRANPPPFPVRPRHSRRRARARRGTAASDLHCPSEPRHHLPRPPLTLLDRKAPSQRRRSTAEAGSHRCRPPAPVEPPPRIAPAPTQGTRR